MKPQNAKTESATALLKKADPNTPCIKFPPDDVLAISAGTTFAGVTFSEDTPIVNASGDMVAGTDYGVVLLDGVPSLEALSAAPDLTRVLGGFHFAPGGNAKAREGGDDVPAINPCSVWDLNFRPACGDARGMTLVEGPRGKFWADIYLLGADHTTLGMTSKHGVVIADGDSPPEQDSDESFEELDYKTAVTVMGYHGKQLLSYDEFVAAAYGVTERSAAKGDPSTTKLDAPRTSKFGLMQATGNLWVWGHDGDPDDPRPSIFGGSWVSCSYAGSRCAGLGTWAERSTGLLGARGRSDHLQLA